MSKNIAKVLDAYLFDKDNVEESMSISLEEWIRKYKPIKNIDESNIDLVFNRDFPAPFNT